MKTYFIQLIIFGACVSGLGCATKTLTSYDRSFDSLVKMPMGADKNQVLKTFGTPSRIDNSEIGTQVYVYSFPYKNLQIPKITISIGRDGKVIAKGIWLYEQHNDVKTRQEVEALFKDSSFSVRTGPEPKDGHYISTVKYLEDKKSGVSVETRRDMVTSISWQLPGANADRLSSDP